ncbi:phosphatase PAP2 family protein [Knoellia sp. CPCC 206453]|uniref:phosphatase PAP2 family protein n=1 Tax=Knoellia pratensis TaxID=3404796 RepID=UPI0036082EBD
MPPRTHLASSPPAAGRTFLLAAGGVVAASVVAVGGLVDGVNENADLSAYDPGITSSVASLRRTGLTIAAEVASLVGSEVCVAVLSLAALAWLWFVRRDRARAVLFAGAMGLGVVLTLAGKHLVERHRPPAGFVVGPVDTGYSFPSGHTLFSTAFLGLVVMLLIWPSAGRRARVAAVVAAVLASLVIGASRVYLGYHWTTDVIAAWVLGVAVLTVTLALASPTMAVATMLLTRLGLDSDAPGVVAPDHDPAKDGHASPAR